MAIELVHIAPARSRGTNDGVTSSARRSGVAQRERLWCTEPRVAGIGDGFAASGILAAQPRPRIGAARRNDFDTSLIPLRGCARGNSATSTVCGVYRSAPSSRTSRARSVNARKRLAMEDTKVLSVRLPHALVREIEHDARGAGVTPGEHVRHLLLHHYASKEGDLPQHRVIFEIAKNRSVLLRYLDAQLGQAKADELLRLAEEDARTYVKTFNGPAGGEG